MTQLTKEQIDNRKRELEIYMKNKRYHKTLADANRISSYEDIQNSDKDIILTALGSYGIHDVLTNGYWFNFHRHGFWNNFCRNEYYVELVNQQCRLLVEFYHLDMKSLFPHICDLVALQYEDPATYHEITQLYDYHDIIMDGRDMKQHIDRLMQILP